MCKKDLKFGLCVKTGAKNDERKVIEGWATKEYHEDLSPWHGWHTATEDQTLLLHIDNVSSWTGREIKYFTYVKDPKTKKEGEKEKVVEKDEKVETPTKAKSTKPKSSDPPKKSTSTKPKPDDSK